MSFIAVFLISSGILALQILQTRIFSFTLWHHLAYMVITVALLGMGASGTWLAVRKRKPERPYRFLAYASLAFSISTLASLALALRVPLDTYMADKILQLGYIFLYYLLLVFPYFFAGVVISFMFSLIRERINVYYLANLLGSAIGGLAILPVMEMIGAEGAVLITAFAGVPASFFFIADKKDKYPFIVTILVLIIFAAIYPVREKVLPVRSPVSKTLGAGFTLDPEQKVLYTKWDRVARIDVFENRISQEFFNYFPELNNKVITIDGDAYTLLYKFPPAVLKDRNYPALSDSLYSTAYFTHEEPDVLVVGLGGGTDIINALYHNANSVTGVEINKAMIEVTQDVFASFAGNPYQDPRVNIVHSEGRSYIRRSDDKFDIIQMSGVDTWTALSTGAYVMSESYIYTTDAIREYIEHLKDDGTLSIIRWLFWPPREMLRLCTETVSVLREMGIKNPENNIVIIGDGALASILVKKRAFTWSELNQIDDSTHRTFKNRIIYAPGLRTEEEYYDPIFERQRLSRETGLHYLDIGFWSFFKAVENGTEKEFIRNYEYDVEPVSDDKPFFFHYYKLKHLFQADNATGSLVDSFPIGLLILTLSFIQALFFSILFIITPLFFMGSSEKAVSPGSQVTYFFMIGTGFMFIEMSIIQQFVLFLGNPADAIAVTIMILLLFTGIGALFSKKLLIKFGEKLIFRNLMIFFPLIVMGYAVLVPYVTHELIHLTYPMRIVSSTLILAPLGLLLGQFFPTALTIVGEKNSSFIPFAYAVNSVASVVASIFSIILAMAYGFTFVFTMAAFCYFIAGAAFYRFVKKHV